MIEYKALEIKAYSALEESDKILERTKYADKGKKKSRAASLSVV